MKDKIDFNTFVEISSKLEIKLGTITDVQRMEKSDKMLKLTVDFGGEDIRTVMTNIGNREGLSREGEAEDVLTDMQFPFVTNLEPAKMMGVVSEAMIVIAQNGDNIEIENPSNGSVLI